MSATSSPAPSLPKGPRISQRQPTACAECSRRKVRCDKQIPCMRCVRLGKNCLREVVRTTKSISANRDELLFLRNLRECLPESENLEEARRELMSRISYLEHGQRASPGSERDTSPATQESHTFTDLPKIDDSEDSSSISAPRQETGNRNFYAVVPISQTSAKNAATMRCLESLCWGRTTGQCFPHRRCNCSRYRKYSELASINCDLSSPILQWVSANVDLGVLLPIQDSRKLIKFHMDCLWWHHNTFHSLTFLEQCEVFWTRGTVVHGLWTALYLAISCTTLWSLMNSPRHRRELGIDFHEDLIDRQYRAMVQILYREDFLETPSMFSIQAITVATRVAHNLGHSSLSGNLLVAAYGIARSLGLHQIHSPDSPAHRASPAPTLQPRPTWFEAIELEVGKRTWWQLVIQDHFSIPFSDTYIVHASQFSTDLPRNCNDNDLIEQPDNVPTTSSYTRTIAREARLMPQVLDGLGPIHSRKPLGLIYEHVLKCDMDMRQVFHGMPLYLLRDPDQGNPTKIPWLSTARRTMAISAADKIICTHRPILFYSFQNPAFSATRATCTSAAVTILREHERATADETLSVWTHTAFCITASIVLGLDLLYRTSHTDEQANEYRNLLTRASERLRKRRVDTLATACAKLVDVILEVEEELVIKAMRKHGGSLEETQQEAINEVIMSQDILAKFLDLNVGFDMPEWPWTTPVAVQAPEAGFQDIVAGDFNVWFDEVFGATQGFGMG